MRILDSGLKTALRLSWSPAARVPPSQLICSVVNIQQQFVPARQKKRGRYPVLSRAAMWFQTYECQDFDAELGPHFACE